MSRLVTSKGKAKPWNSARPNASIFPCVFTTCERLPPVAIALLSMGASKEQVAERPHKYKT